MHRYRIVAQVSLILSIFNLVLAAPTVVHWQKIHEARGTGNRIVPEVGSASPQSSPASPQYSSDGDEMVVPEDAKAAPNGPTSPQLAPASPQHSLDGSESTLSGYPTPHLSEASSESGNSWMLERPPRLSTNGPASFQGFAPALQLTGSNRATTRPGGLVPPPTETPTDNAGSVDDIRYKKIRIATELGVAGGVIALIALAIQQNNEKQQTP